MGLTVRLSLYAKYIVFVPVGRYWTGGLRTVTNGRSGMACVGKTDLRAGVAAVDWLTVKNDGKMLNTSASLHRAAAIIPINSKAVSHAGGAIAVSGSDDGSVDLWQAVDAEAGAGPATLRHLEGAMAHSHLVRECTLRWQTAKTAASDVA